MNLFTSVYIFILFVILTPGILLTLPPNSKPLTVAIVHGIVFALIWKFTYKYVWNLSQSQSRSLSKY